MTACRHPPPPGPQAMLTPVRGECRWLIQVCAWLMLDVWSCGWVPVTCCLDWTHEVSYREFELGLRSCCLLGADLFPARLLLLARCRQGLEGFPIQLSLEDLDTLTENRALCNDDGELDLASFERLIRYQLQARRRKPLCLSSFISPSFSTMSIPFQSSDGVAFHRPSPLRDCFLISLAFRYSKNHIVYLQLYVIRILAAAMEKASRGQGGGGGDDHAGVVLFVLKVSLDYFESFVFSLSCSNGRRSRLSEFRLSHTSLIDH